MSTLKDILENDDPTLLEQYFNQHPTEINEKVGKTKYLPAHIAVKKGSIKMVKALIKLGAKWDYEDQDSASRVIPLFLCVINDQWELLHWVAKNQNDLLMMQDSDGYTIIHQLIEKRKHSELIELAFILSRWDKWNSLLNLGDNDNLTPLMLAAVMKDTKGAKALFKSGDISINDQLKKKSGISSIRLPKGFTALHISAGLADLDMVELLMKHDARQIYNNALFLPRPREVIATLSLEKRGTKIEKKILSLLISRSEVRGEVRRKSVDLKASFTPKEKESKNTLSKVKTREQPSASKSKPTLQLPTKRDRVFASDSPNPSSTSLSQLPTSLSTLDKEAPVFKKQKLERRKSRDLQDAIFNPDTSVHRVDSTAAIKKHSHVEGLVINNYSPVPNSLVVGSLFSQLKIHFGILKKVSIVRGQELLEALLIIIQSIMSQSSNDAVTKLWIVNTEKRDKIVSKRKLDNLVVRTKFSDYISKDDANLGGATEIGLFCPLSAAFFLSNLLEVKEVDQFKAMLIVTFKDQARMKREYKFTQLDDE